MQLGVALDEPNKNDHVYETNGIKFILDKSIRKDLKGISISLVDTIFGKKILAEDLYAPKGGCC